MRKLREALRLHFEAKASGRAIARSLGISPSTAVNYLSRIKVAKLSWPLPAELLDDAALNRLLFPDELRPQLGRPEPDWPRVHLELRKKHVTLLLVWQEYREGQPDGFQYSQFCARYAAWAGTLGVTMRQTHRAGEKTFVDFSGDGIDIVDPRTGECRVAKLFVAVLGASSLTFVEPTLSENLPTWIDCHVRAANFFGGTSEIWVPDNLKSGVLHPNRYEPDLNPTYAELARHYGAVIIPARVRRPRDKAKVEQGVLLAERWILAVLRHRTFFSLHELREAIKPLVEKLNDRKMQKLKKSRRQLFEEVERAALKPLPATAYEFAEWKRPRVNIDYHVEFDEHFYSVPYTLAHKQIDLRATHGTVELFLGGNRITSHLRSSEKHRHTTKPEHMPASHRSHAEWTPSRIVGWARTVGPSTVGLVEEIMRRRPHPEQGFRSCLGILSLRKRYPDARIERACARALRHRACTYKSVAAILKNDLDGVDETAGDEKQGTLPLHGNVRGSTYYH